MVSKEKNPSNSRTRSVPPRGGNGRDVSGSRSPGVRKGRLQSQGRRVSRKGAEARQVPQSRSKATVEGNVRKRSSDRGKGRAVKISLGLAVLTALIAFSAYHVWTEGYQVASKLLFLKGEQKGADRVSWPLEKEIEILKSSALRSFLAAGLFDAPRGADCRPGTGVDAPGSAVLRHGLARFKDRREFEEWLTESFGASGAVSNGVAKVHLTLNGDDPDFLKAVMEECIRRYVEHRNSWAPTPDTPMRLASVDRGTVPPTPTPPRLGVIDDRIHELTMSRREVELALRNLDSGNGIFRGFVPVSQGAGTSYLQRFQDKIVELEIKKRSMAARFTSRSSEVRALNQEIKGIRSAMREALGSHLVFLKRKAEGLQERRAQLAGTGGPVRASRLRKEVNKPCSGRFNGRDSWYFANDGLYIITDRPSTVQRPLMVKAGRFTRTLYASLFSPDSTSGTTTAVAKASDGADEGIVLTGCVTINGPYTECAKASLTGNHLESERVDLAPDPSFAGQFRMVSAGSSEAGFVPKRNAPAK